MRVVRAMVGSWVWACARSREWSARAARARMSRWDLHHRTESLLALGDRSHHREVARQWSCLCNQARRIQIREKNQMSSDGAARTRVRTKRACTHDAQLSDLASRVSHAVRTPVPDLRWVIGCFAPRVGGASMRDASGVVDDARVQRHTVIKALPGVVPHDWLGDCSRAAGAAGGDSMASGGRQLDRLRSQKFKVVTCTAWFRLKQQQP